MWLDNASDIDILFYEPYANVISEIALNKNYKPLTIGVFGVWGAGKSTLLNLVESKIDDMNSKKNVCVKINAWTFEGYEDAKIAVIEALLRELHDKCPVKEKISKLIKKLDFLKISTKAISIGAPLITSVMTGNPIPIVLGLSGSATDIVEGIKKASDAVQDICDNYMKDDASESNSVVNNIRKFRKEFEEALDGEKIENVVVLIDDLDRCQPDRIIETLEAIKLFLSVNKTTFVIAADEKVIQYAIHRKYPPIAEYSVYLEKEYIEKIIQLPISIPELSTKDIENYLMLLVAQLYINPDQFKEMLKKIKEEGMLVSEKRIDSRKLKELSGEKVQFYDKKTYYETLEVIEGIKSIVAGNLKGNPRQAKRFLNTFITKRKLADSYFGENGIEVKLLAKLLVLQKLNNDLFIQLNEWNRAYTTENEGFKKMRMAIMETDGEIDNQYKVWNSQDIVRWLKTEPVEMEKKNLDRYFYLTREHLRSAEINELSLSLEAKSILQKIGDAPQTLYDRIVDEMQKLSYEDQNNIITVLIPKIERGELDLLLVRHLFEKDELHRGKLLGALSKVNKKIEMGSLLPLRKMYQIDQAGMDTVIEDWKKAGNISDGIIKKIKDDK